MKHHPLSKQQLLLKLVEEKHNDEFTRGMLADQLIDLWLKWKSYDWDKESLQEYWELKKKWMALFAFGKMNDADIKDMVQQIKDELDIDLAAPRVLTEEMCEEG